MANYKQYTNSPLGLIPRDIIAPYGLTASGDITDEYRTQFSGQNKYYRYQKTGKNNNVFASKGSKLHTDEIYNISTQNIIDQFQGIRHLSLKYADFAYLKDYGVYPNNRLIILRRFANPVTDDIYSLGDSDGPGTPISTIIGYVDNETDFLNFDFGEEWTAAQASFKDILNSIGKDFSIGGASLNLGNYAKAAGNFMPSPPASVLLQRRVLANLGLINEEDVSAVPLGDPNLIKEARVRKTLGSEEAGSGLTGKIKVTFTVRYEQKFIQGVDPTLVYMDILGTLLSMGTSKSSFYLGTNSKIEEFIRGIIKDPVKKLKEFIKAIVDEIGPIVEKVTRFLSSAGIRESKEQDADVQKKADDFGTRVGRFLRSGVDSINEIRRVGGRQFFASAQAGFNNESQESGLDIEAEQEILNVINETLSYVSDYITKRYRVQAFGVMAALTGAASTPWHVTIGNPLRPILCSGDMECEDINVKLGPQLSFNDLPTYIEATIKLSSARNNGLQELFSKMNSGGLRTVNEKKSSIIEPGVTFWSNTLNLKNTTEQVEEAPSTTERMNAIQDSFSKVERTVGQNDPFTQIEVNRETGDVTATVLAAPDQTGSPQAIMPDSFIQENIIPASDGQESDGTLSFEDILDVDISANEDGGNLLNRFNGQLSSENGNQIANQIINSGTIPPGVTIQQDNVGVGVLQPGISEYNYSINYGSQTAPISFEQFTQISNLQNSQNTPSISNSSGGSQYQNLYTSDF